jgi:hypothetical protein
MIEPFRSGILSFNLRVPDLYINVIHLLIIFEQLPITFITYKQKDEDYTVRNQTKKL